MNGCRNGENMINLIVRMLYCCVVVNISRNVYSKCCCLWNFDMDKQRQQYLLLELTMNGCLKVTYAPQHISIED